jgi:hypothetical protein
MLDWMMLSVEAIGIVILLCWIIVPIREFKSIFKRLREENKRDAEPHRDVEAAGVDPAAAASVKEAD